MRKKLEKLQYIDHDHLITRESDSEFWYHLQYSLLLALKEQGRLNPIQCRYAIEQLNRQKNAHQKNLQMNPGTP